MDKIIKTGKIAALFFLAVVILSLTSCCALLAYHNLFTPDLSYYASAFPFEKADLDPEAVISNLTESDFEQYPVLNQLVNTPQGGSIEFKKFEYEQIEDFRNRYGPIIEINSTGENIFIDRYLFWNGTYYQIPIAQS